MVGSTDEINWPSVNDHSNWVKSTCGFIILFIPLLHIFDIFQNKIIKNCQRQKINRLLTFVRFISEAEIYKMKLKS